MADNLAQFGLKKGPIQKALDSLSESGKIRCKVLCWEIGTANACIESSRTKFLRHWGSIFIPVFKRSALSSLMQEFGKTKIYVATQDQTDLPDKQVYLQQSVLWC